jgi:tRNA (guanine37-N1)-methyltransferase
MKRFELLTLIPEAVTPYAEASILGRAQKAKKIKIQAHQLRDWATDKHNKTDDTPYGGGPGMVMKIEPIDRAVKSLKLKVKSLRKRVILTAASGQKFTQADAKRLAKYDQLIFICGRYEGVDGRVEQHIADEALSIGDYVLTGGELPALVMIDAIARQVKGVLGKAESLANESHTVPGVLEYPQYTKPEVYEVKESKSKKIKKLIVPPVLLSGDHAKIEAWRLAQSKKM